MYKEPYQDEQDFSAVNFVIAANTSLISEIDKFLKSLEGQNKIIISASPLTISGYHPLEDEQFANILSSSFKRPKPAPLTTDSLFLLPMIPSLTKQKKLNDKKLTNSKETKSEVEDEKEYLSNIKIHWDNCYGLNLK